MLLFSTTHLISPNKDKLTTASQVAYLNVTRFEYHRPTFSVLANFSIVGHALKRTWLGNSDFVSSQTCCLFESHFIDDISKVAKCESPQIKKTNENRSQMFEHPGFSFGVTKPFLTHIEQLKKTFLTVTLRWLIILFSIPHP